MYTWLLVSVVRNVLLLVGAVMALVGLANAAFGIVGWDHWFDPAHNFDLVAAGCLMMLGGLALQNTP